VIVLDTHIWIWWVDNNSRLTQRLQQLISTHQSNGLGVSVFSYWEVATQSSLLFPLSYKGAQGLAADVRYYGQWMRDEAFKRIGLILSVALCLDGVTLDQCKCFSATIK